MLAMKFPATLLCFLLNHLLVANVFGQDRIHGLRDIADDQLSVERSGSFEIGFAAHNNFWLNEGYKEVAAKEYSIMTPENQMKMRYLQPEEGVYTFEDADHHVQFARDNNMLVHGHALVWHHEVAEFVLEKDWNRETLLALMTDHIKTVVGHYRGKVAVWDVCNEVFEDYGLGLRKTIWRDVIGTDYIDIAFRLAREADPDAVLLLNDYKIEEKNMKSNQMYNYVKGMIKRGVPIDAIGMQGHLTVGSHYDFCSIAANMQRFADLGLDIYITELDVAIRVDDSDSQLAMQAELYEKMTTTCLDQPACMAVQTWGFTDLVSWIPFVKPGFGMALPFDKRFEAKPAYFAIQSSMLGTASSVDQCDDGFFGAVIRFFKRIFAMFQQLFFRG